MKSSVEVDGTAGLERSAHPELLRIGTTSAIVHGTGPARTSAHAQPGWKLVVARGGQVGAVTETGEQVVGDAIVVAPGVRHHAWSSDGYAAILFDPGVLPAPSGTATMVALDRGQVGPATSVLATEVETPVDELTDRLVPTLGRTLGLRVGPLDGRVAEALAVLDAASSLEATAASVGLSPSQLRRLVRSELGVPLRRVRSWRRLREAVLAAGSPLAAPAGASLATAAATAGFADQAHLARTARQLVGRTTMEVTRSHAAGGLHRV